MYVKITPSARLTVALPTDRIPPGERVIPAGKAAPFADMPNVPPVSTPVGSVVARLNVLLLPTGNDGRVTFQAGAGDCAGAGAGDGAAANDTGSVGSLPPHPASANRPAAAAADLSSVLRFMLRNQSTSPTRIIGHIPLQPPPAVW